MKKIIGLAIATVLILVAVGGATWATFSDQETSTNNTLSTGTLDLNINNGNSAVTTFTASNIKPNDSVFGNSTLKNVGSLSGTLSVTTSAVTGTAGTNNGDPDIVPTDSLRLTATMAMYVDVNSSSSWNAGDIGLKSDGSFYNYATAGANNLATGTATVAGGVITGISVSAGGTGYTNGTDVVSITDSTGSGAIYQANIVGGAVASFTKISGGSGYSASPTVKVLEYSSVLFDTMNNYGGKTWSTILTMAPNATSIFQTACLVPNTAGNAIQGGSATANFTFTLNQQ